jgi:hypothetical protein
MRCPFRFRRLPEAVLRCMSGAARILASTVYTASIYIASRRAHRTEEARASSAPALPRGFPIVEQFHYDYAPSFYRHMQLFFMEKLHMESLPPETPAAELL